MAKPSAIKQRRRARRKANRKLPAEYEEAQALALGGKLSESLEAYEKLYLSTKEKRIRALIHNDVAAVKTIGAAKQSDGVEGFEKALEIDPDCQIAQQNLSFLQATRDGSERGIGITGRKDRKTRVAVLSFLFNWPSRGGGIIHTVELVQFLSQAGYDVRHIYASFPAWGIGATNASLPIDSEAIQFDEPSWTLESICEKYRQRVDAFDPDCVLITDCWNFKPHLAEAVAAYPFFLRQQALECLCPLNNLRLLAESPDTIRQCPQNQLASPSDCYDCLGSRGQNSGALHQAERQLSQVGTLDYFRKLRTAMRHAEAVLTLNPAIAELIRPFARRTEVVTWGMNEARFQGIPMQHERNGIVRVFMAGDVRELMKGFHVLQEACAILRSTRGDFEVVATGEPAGPVNQYTSFTGWLSQEDLVIELAKSDILVMPTIAQEGLGRTTVEAMALGKPTVASDIGGLPYTVRDGESGLLCRPGDPQDLAQKLERLISNRDLRRQYGENGRARFLAEFTWEKVISDKYGPLIKAARRKREETSA